MLRILSNGLWLAANKVKESNPRLSKNTYTNKQSHLNLRHHALCTEELHNLARFQNKFITCMGPLPIFYLILAFAFTGTQYQYVGPLHLVSKHFTDFSKNFSEHYRFQVCWEDYK